MATEPKAGAKSMKDVLLAKLTERKAIIGVVGLGYVGLPLALEFARAGFHVIGYDVNKGVVDALMRGESHIKDVPGADVAELVNAGKFETTGEESRLRDTDAISIAVPTP
ncbi:MAG TPA: NAD(P)-binding domain-containing protein, partial [Gemmatimonadaceae bacterium]